MFKNSKERKKMLEMMSSFLDKKATFSCYVDEMFEYHLKNKDEKYIFTFICDDSLIKKMEVEWLLDLKKVQYYNITRIINYVEVSEIEFNINKNIN